MPGQLGIANLSAMRGRKKGGAPTPQTQLPQGMAALAEAFLAHLAARAYSQASIEAHRWALRQFTAWAQKETYVHAASCTRADLERYQMYLHQYRSPKSNKPLVINTQLARLGCVRRFFAWLCRSGLIPANPAADLDLPRKQSRPLPKSLSEQEIALLLAVPNTADPFGLRDRTMLELFYATGIRRAEMTNLDVGDYDPHSQTLIVRKGKGGKSRMLPVGERAAAWVDRFLEESRPRFAHLPGETALFLSGYGTRFTPAYLGNWIKKLMTRCGIDKPGSCHLWRHSCATDMHRGGADIRYIQEMLGHARMETTQIYTHVHIEALREIHTRCHPHGALGPGHDMYGKITPAETSDVDFTFPTSDDPLVASTSMTSAACSADPTTKAVMELKHARNQEPPEDDPPAGNIPKSPTPPKPPTSGGNRANSLIELASLPSVISENKARVAYYGYRWFDPVTGRWPSRDPIQERGGINLYGFVRNNGVSRWDILGMLQNYEVFHDVKIKKIRFNVFNEVKGHWWFAIDGKESYGWYPLPKEPPVYEALITWVEGELNGQTNHSGTKTTDPNHWTPPDISYSATVTFGPWGNQTKRIQYGIMAGAKCSCIGGGAIKDCLRKFAVSYKGKWGIGPNVNSCRDFMMQALDACCLVNM